jgi:peptide-methionine (S)-S-oxide reductase
MLWRDHASMTTGKRGSIMRFIIGFAIALLFGGPAMAAQKTVVVAGGCFWCVEADFESVPGVVSVVSGFSGGTVANPTYDQVKKGKTGHVEAVQITYDDSRLSYEKLVGLFLRSIDPTDGGGQFCDRGPAYRSAIFVSDQAEKAKASAALDLAATDLGQKIATKILPSAPFYPAGAEHQDYYKGKGIVLTRRGPKSQAEAYKFYRNACGRDARVKQLWGAAAPFAK